VCGLTQLKAQELRGEVCALGVDILGVCETWEGKCTPTDIPGYTFVGKRRPGGQGGGVGFYIARALTSILTVHLDTCSPEAMWLELRGCRTAAPPLCIGLVYVPPSALTTAAGVQAAFAALRADVDRFQECGEVALMGDLNCRVGRAQGPGLAVGQYGEPGPADAAGAGLLQLLQDTGLYLLNGRRPVQEPEFTRCRGEERAVLDYVLAPAAWRCRWRPPWHHAVPLLSVLWSTFPGLTMPCCFSVRHTLWRPVVPRPCTLPALTLVC
jgi:hypothetical protein